MRFCTRIVIVFFSVSAILMSCSTSAFFYAPEKKLAYFPDTALYNVEEINFKAANGNMLNGWFLKPKHQLVIASVLQLHGNGGNISYQYQFAAPLVKAGFQVMVFDYEGYGKSAGEASQEHVLDDAIQALHYIKQRTDVKNTKLILFGQSLGGHLACVVAAQEQKLIDALIVEAPFSGHRQIAIYHAKKAYHLPKFLPKLFVPSKYDAIDFIGKVTVPILFIHSTEDGVCPYFMGRELFEKAQAPKTFWEIKGRHIQASHLFSEEFVKRFKEIIK